ncbi:Ldh family oxidoreductase [Candidatus Woesearchaeota archaeon]|nr:Ldh family oxidoreductase [Candidatus Woesearchaeota archaeon]
MQTEGRYKAEDLIEFGTAVLTNVGFPREQAYATSRVLVEADMRGDSAHGIAGGSGLDDILEKFNDGKTVIADYSIDEPKYPTIISVDANGTLGHYVALEILPKVIVTAKQYGTASAYIRNSTHFGDCGIYSEMIAEYDLAARVTCTSPQWTKPFIEPQETAGEDAARYEGVKKRFGTNPIAWSIPYEGGIATIDMAATQRAVSPAIGVSRHNASVLGITKEDGVYYIGVGEKRRRLSEVHYSLARSQSQEELSGKLAELGYEEVHGLDAVQSGLLKGPHGEDINFPFAFDGVFMEQFWIAPLGGTIFGYKGFGLNMLIDLHNVIGGGAAELIRKLEDGRPTTKERVSQTIEAYAIDAYAPLQEAKKRLKESVDTTIGCGNKLMFLPGQKEHESKEACLRHGIPIPDSRIETLKQIASELGLPFDLEPVSR